MGAFSAFLSARFVRDADELIGHMQAVIVVFQAAQYNATMLLGPARASFLDVFSVFMSGAVVPVVVRRVPYSWVLVNKMLTFSPA